MPLLPKTWRKTNSLCSSVQCLKDSDIYSEKRFEVARRRKRREPTAEERTIVKKMCKPIDLLLLTLIPIDYSVFVI